MARFRPEPASEGTVSFLGYQECGILDFTDQSGKYDWADVYIKTSLSMKDSKFPIDHQIAGSWNKDVNGNIEKSTLLNSIYYLLDALGYEGGPNKSGQWEDPDGKEIDIVKELNRLYGHDNPLTDPKNSFLVYVYKQFNEKDGKAYTRVANKIVKNNAAGKADLESWVTYMKSKGYLKEHKGDWKKSPETQTSNQSSTMETSF